MMESKNVNKTYVPKGQVEREWFLVDAEGQNLGRLATKIAQMLIGKHRPDYTPGVLMGANVVVINAEKVDVYPTRLDSKIYYHHSGYPGGIKEISLRRQLEKFPERVIEKAVWGMIPKTKLGRRIYKNLHVYAGSEHPHHGQQPELFE
jgi:large subunit ribosomal protein L13